MVAGQLREANAVIATLTKRPRVSGHKFTNCIQGTPRCFSLGELHARMPGYFLNLWMLHEYQSGGAALFAGGTHDLVPLGCRRGSGLLGATTASPERRGWMHARYGGGGKLVGHLFSG